MPYASMKWRGGGALFETMGILHEAWIFLHLPNGCLKTVTLIKFLMEAMHGFVHNGIICFMKAKNGERVGNVSEP
jgi:hypothetical protein